MVQKCRVLHIPNNNTHARVYQNITFKTFKNWLNNGGMKRSKAEEPPSFYLMQKQKCRQLNFTTQRQILGILMSEIHSLLKASIVWNKYLRILQIDADPLAISSIFFLSKFQNKEGAPGRTKTSNVSRHITYIKTMSLIWTTRSWFGYI